MKKILFLVNHDVVIYNFRLEIVERLVAEGYEVHVSSPYGERIDDLIKLGCIYHKIEMDRHGMNVVKELRLIKEYKRLIKKVRPDFCFGFTIKPNIYGALAAQGMNVPFVANITGLGTAVENPGIAQRILIMLYRRSFRNIRRVFFQNTENQQFFINHKIALGKHELLPGSGVNLARFVPLEYPDDSTTEFVFISRIMKEKGIDQYLDAAEYIKKKYPKTIFHICGFCESEYEGKLDECVKSGVVIYHGMVRDVKKILENTHCTIHPSYYPEGLSNVLLESSACARPIITTNRSGCREVIDDEVNGFICKQKDSKDLIKQIEKFLEKSWEEKKQMGLNGRKKVEKEFDRQIVVEKYIKELEK